MGSLGPPASSSTNTNLSFSTSAQPHPMGCFWSSVIANYSVTLLRMYSLISSLFFPRKWGLMQLFCMSVPPCNCCISSPILNKFSRGIEFLRIVVKFNGIQQLRVLRPVSPLLERKVRRTYFFLPCLPLAKQLIGVHTLVHTSQLRATCSTSSSCPAWWMDHLRTEGVRDRELWK